MTVSYHAAMTAPSHPRLPGPRRPGPGRPREFDTDLALDRAIAVFSERGYHGAAISDLTQALGLTAGSLYKAFTDKRGLFLAAFDRYVAVRTERLRAALEGAPTGRAKIKAVLDFYADSSHGADGRRGCLVVAGAVDLATADPEVAARVTGALHLNEGRLAGFVAEGQADGTVAPHLDPMATARLLLCVLQGMRVVGKTGRDRAEMAPLADNALKLLD
ncbi:TetR/AcrR family transcriptional regulator [Nitrospirillum sp. BR 11828]|uniref:TetR/AcrR family transcriptional regulator n=1 Tax=Nitrospirillum sp. BR 11828 TaxID=3104325 RepID=UPI002ACA8177|nr:TetR/AcrR family transcriptional regulator [Nitrospirillum sp. BR 11828]MDZ5647198.1 TetR/AcrR family transcriptional regulator [Nitrospirillum sp. BR 11828]